MVDDFHGLLMMVNVHHVVVVMVVEMVYGL